MSRRWFGADEPPVCGGLLSGAGALPAVGSSSGGEFFGFVDGAAAVVAGFCGSICAGRACGSGGSGWLRRP